MSRPIKNIDALTDLGRIRLSENFYMRDFLYSEISNFYGIPNVPDNKDLAVEAGTKLCENLLEPIQKKFGRIAIRSAYRSCEVNGFGNQNDLKCARNEKNYGHHIWDRRDKDGDMGATACIVVPWFADQYAQGKPWQSLAWWIHDNLEYSSMYFFPKLAAFNLNWNENPKRIIDSYVKPVGNLTKAGKDNWQGNHAEEYAWFDEALK